MASRTLAAKVWPRNDTGHLCSHFTGQAGGGATLNFKGAVGTDVPPHHGRRRLRTTRRESKPDEGLLEQDRPGTLKDVVAGLGGRDHRDDHAWPTNHVGWQKVLPGLSVGGRNCWLLGLATRQSLRRQRLPKVKVKQPIQKTILQ